MSENKEKVYCEECEYHEIVKGTPACWRKEEYGEQYAERAKIYEICYDVNIDGYCKSFKKKTRQKSYDECISCGEKLVYLNGYNEYIVVKNDVGNKLSIRFKECDNENCIRYKLLCGLDKIEW